MKFEEDFDFETANAQFHKDDIDKELQSKLKLKGAASAQFYPLKSFSLFDVYPGFLVEMDRRQATEWGGNC